MSIRRKHKAELGIVELAVDPTDVDRQSRHGSQLRSQQSDDRGLH